MCYTKGLAASDLQNALGHHSRYVVYVFAEAEAQVITADIGVPWLTISGMIEQTELGRLSFLSWIFRLETDI